MVVLATRSATVHGSAASTAAAAAAAAAAVEAPAEADSQRASTAARAALRAELCAGDATELARMHAAIVPLGERAFGYMDVSHTGSVTALDALKLYARLGVTERALQSEAWGEMLREANAAGGGVLSRAEWNRWVFDCAEKACAPYEIVEIFEELRSITNDLRRASAMLPLHFDAIQISSFAAAVVLGGGGGGTTRVALDDVSETTSSSSASESSDDLEDDIIFSD